MEKKYLAVNIGSTSKRYSIYSGNESIFNIHIQKKGNKYEAESSWSNESYSKETSKKDFDNSVEFLKKSLLSFGIIEKYKEISVIGIRIVSPGKEFTEHSIMDKNFINHLKEMQEFAPLHISPVLKEIKDFEKYFPKIKLVGVSDSAFHCTLNEETKRYALPKGISKKLGIYRQGYHGISASSVLYELAKKEKLPSKIIVCHLGGGSSITAVKDGKSVDTSMGFTPLEGIMGSTRAGDVDAGALFYLMKKMKIGAEECERILNEDSGMKGLSGIFDMRVLIKEERKNKDAEYAIKHFVYSIKKYLGAYYAILEGIDAIIFTGAMGSDSPKIRKYICEGLESIGVVLDDEKNFIVVGGKDGKINSEKSKVEIIVINPREMDEMYREMRKLVG